MLDQGPSTVPSKDITSSNSTATYENKEIGAYYFHIRAHNSDGWGNTTHFKVNIKEPDPKINTELQKPLITEIQKSESFINNISDGTISGLKIIGTTEPNFTVNLIFSPPITLPEGKMLSIVADDQGKFEYLIDFPIGSGHYKLITQGQNDKILTPISDETIFETSQAKGGTINILTIDDTDSPKEEVKSAGDPSPLFGFGLAKDDLIFYGLLVLIPLAFAIVLIVIFLKKRKTKKIITSIKSK